DHIARIDHEQRVAIGRHSCHPAHGNIAAATTHILDVELLSPSFRQFLCEQARDRICRTARRVGNDHAHGSVGVALCPRTRRERPCRRTTEQRYELAAVHSITSLAMACNVKGTVSPSAFAVFRLMTNSNLVGACTGRSPAFSPLRMRSAYEAARRKLSDKSTP